MPFVTEEHRINPSPAIPGDRCYIVYKGIVDEWRANPRWTTADRLARELIEYLSGGATTPYKASALLAYMIFFCREVIPYENAKAKENGEI